MSLVLSTVAKAYGPDLAAAIAKAHGDAVRDLEEVRGNGLMLRVESIDVDTTVVHLDRPITQPVGGVGYAVEVTVEAAVIGRRVPS